MELNNILVISGKPGLSQVLSQVKNGAVVVNLLTGVKSTVFHNARISSLAEIRLYTTDGETPLQDVLEAIYRNQQAQPLPFEPKTAPDSQLFECFAQALPNYDTDRVHSSDVKKVLQWYNILLQAGKLTPTEEDNSDAETTAVTDEPKAATEANDSAEAAGNDTPAAN